MAEYNQEDAATLRRGLSLVVGILLVVAAVWFLLWLAFFRDSKPKTDETQQSNSNTSQHQSNGSNSSQNNTNKNSSGSDQSTSGTHEATPDHLANTGAGSVVVPAAAAAVVGTTLYQLRLRRKART